MTQRYPRRRNRLRYLGYDYAQPGAVFVTICTCGRQPLFGVVDQGEMVTSLAGAMVEACWQRIPTRYPAIGLDSMVIMPDHVHGILFTGIGPELAEARTTVGDAVRWFKAVTVRAYRDGVLDHVWEPYDRHLWQDRFHDRIIRDPGELETRRAYIEGNPSRWWERHEAARTEPVGFRHRAWDEDGAIRS